MSKEFDFSILESYHPKIDKKLGLDRFPIEPIEGAEDRNDVELWKVESNATAHIKVTIKAPIVDNAFLAEVFQQLADVYSMNS